jgi:peptidyl-prolyl cis-trans isomerase C
MQADMRKLLKLLGAVLIALGITRCNYPGSIGLNQPPVATATPAAPTPTPVPLAAQVNGEPITLETYQNEIARFEGEQSRAGIDLATMPDYRLRIIWALIDLTLLAQGATEAGYEVSQSEIDARIADLQASLGSPAEFDTWLSENLYSLDSFRSALIVERQAAEMVASIADSIPSSAEQVHARHILVATLEQAENLRARVVGGEDFSELAQVYSIDASTRPAGGDLGWFPEGYLLWPELDQAAYGSAPGELSQVLQTELGYHLLEVLERGEHQLDYEARLYLQEQAVQDWLAEQKEVDDIQVFIES